MHKDRLLEVEDWNFLKAHVTRHLQIMVSVFEIIVKGRSETYTAFTVADVIVSFNTNLSDEDTLHNFPSLSFTYRYLEMRCPRPQFCVM